MLQNDVCMHMCVYVCECVCLLRVNGLSLFLFNYDLILLFMEIQVSALYHPPSSVVFIISPVVTSVIFPSLGLWWLFPWLLFIDEDLYVWRTVSPSTELPVGGFSSQTCKHFTAISSPFSFCAKLPPVIWALSSMQTTPWPLLTFIFKDIYFSLFSEI